MTESFWQSASRLLTLCVTPGSFHSSNFVLTHICARKPRTMLNQLGVMMVCQLARVAGFMRGVMSLSTVLMRDRTLSTLGGKWSSLS